MTPATLARLALAGTRTDRLRMFLTALSALPATLALLAAATVAAVPELPGDADNHRYSSPLIDEPGLRPGVIMALLLAALPVLAMAGQCIRLGSPARDRRLAAIRLAGATPGQAVLISAGETVAAALLGSVTGLAAYVVLHRLLHRPGPQGPPLPTDLWPPVWSVVAIVLLVPVLAGAAGALLMRRVIVTPLGVVRRVDERKPSVLPGILILAGVFAPVVLEPVGRWLSDVVEGLGSLAIVLFPIGAIIGVVTGAGWIAYTTGRVLHRFARRPGALLAGRMLLADPWSGSRTQGALLSAVVVGAVVLAIRATLTTEFEAQNLASGGQARPPEDVGFYLGTIDLINVTVLIAMVVAAGGILVALAEGIVSRRRVYAAQIATGVPRRTLAASIAWQTLAPLIPATLAALTVGLWLVRATGTEMSSSESICTARCDSADPEYVQSAVTLAVPVPVRELVLLGAGTVALTAVVLGVGLLLLRASTDIEELRTT